MAFFADELEELDKRFCLDRTKTGLPSPEIEEDEERAEDES